MRVLNDKIADEDIHYHHKPIFISVVIIAYNRKEFLVNAIESVMNQTLSKDNYEILVIKNFRDPIIDKFIEENNIKNVYSGDKTLSGKIANALNICKGNVISFLEDDDLFLKNKLEYVYNLFNNNKDLVFYRNAVSFIDDFRNLLNINNMEPDFNLSAMSIYKDILNINGLEGILTGVDTFVYFVALDSGGKVVYNDKILSYYRRHESETHPTGSLNNIIISRISVDSLIIASLQKLYTMLHDTSLKKKVKYRILSFELNSNLMLSLIKKNYKYKIDRNDIIFWLKNARYRSYSDHGVIENIKSFFHNISILILLRVPVFFKRNLIKNYLESI